ncbi:MAG: phenylalanine 4-monooxygenase [Sphingosinicella sp.]|uniref:phenylalanine 4-monooxygenase n=1 Tax=Sphingosinicella sp. TaxID=1917971 RepID=UPI004037E3EA
MLTETIIETRAGDWIVPQNWARFTSEEHRVWDVLFARQQAALRGRAVVEFFQGLDVLHLSKPGIPDFDELNERLFARTGWEVVSVPGLVPDEVFFAHLSRRRFPAGNFIRGTDSLDYIEQPDVFHDVFGHVPLLALPAVADFMQAMGEAGLAAMEAGALHRLARLYWYSVEFGLAREAGATRIYGAGLLSSFGESRFALESETPRRARFDLGRVLRTPYRSDAFQRDYFILDRLDDLPRLLDAVDLAALYRELEALPDLSL